MRLILRRSKSSSDADLALDLADDGAEHDETTALKSGIRAAAGGLRQSAETENARAETLGPNGRTRTSLAEDWKRKQLNQHSQSLRDVSHQVAKDQVKGASSTIAWSKTSAENKNTRLDRDQDNGELSDMAQKYGATLDTTLDIFPRIRHSVRALTPIEGHSTMLPTQKRNRHKSRHNSGRYEGRRPTKP
jgi:hypothetical protein